MGIWAGKEGALLCNLRKAPGTRQALIDSAESAMYFGVGGKMKYNPHHEFRKKAVRRD